MLTREERQEIEAEIEKCGDPRAACIEALGVLQKRRGWVSDESLREVAALLQMTPDELDGVATFYNLIYRRPVGRHVITICNSVSCWMRGYLGVLEHLQARLGIELGQTTADGRFTLLPIVCLGACDQAPAMMVGDELYGNLTPERIDEVLATYG